jgi:hypothetical protein
MAVALDPRTVQTPALELIDQALVDLMDTPDGRLIVIMPPQEGKSQRVTRRFPTWMLSRTPTPASRSRPTSTVSPAGGAARSATTSATTPSSGSGSATTCPRSPSGSSPATTAASTPSASAAPSPAAPSTCWSSTTRSRTASRPTPRTYREAVWDWWTDVASTRLAPGAPVVLILTRWHEDDLAGRLLAAEDGDTWRCCGSPRRPTTTPSKGETDPLDREVGEFLESARGRTPRSGRDQGPRRLPDLERALPGPAVVG